MAIKEKEFVVNLDIPKDDLEMIEHAAFIKGQSLNSYIVSAAIKAAVDDISKENVITVSEKDWERLMELMENPPEPNEALKELMRGSHVRPKEP